MSPAAWSEDDLPGALLVLAPHQDDEILGCGRLMRRVSQAGGRIVVAWMTDGGGSHGDLAPEDRAALVARRRREALEGVAEMGIDPVDVAFLGYPDGGLAEVGLAEPAARLQALCEAHGVDTAVVTDGGDGHADHRAAFAIARRLRVARLFSYPVSGRYDGHAYDPPTDARQIPPDPSDDKRRALRKHRSQTLEGGARFPLSDETIARFCAEPEVFIPFVGIAP